MVGKAVVTKLPRLTLTLLGVPSGTQIASYICDQMGAAMPGLADALFTSNLMHNYAIK